MSAINLTKYSIDRLTTSNLLGVTIAGGQQDITNSLLTTIDIDTSNIVNVGITSFNSTIGTINSQHPNNQVSVIGGVHSTLGDIRPLTFISDGDGNKVQTYDSTAHGRIVEVRTRQDTTNALLSTIDSDTSQLVDIGVSTNILTFDTQPLGHGLEVRLRGGAKLNTLGQDIRHDTIFGSSGLNEVSTTLRTLGLSPLASLNFLSYASTPSQMRLTSDSGADITGSGVGARAVLLIGLDGNWNPISEVVATGGTAGTLTTRTDWFRINQMIVIDSGTHNSNFGTMFLTSASDTLTGGVPDNIVYNNILPDSGNSFVFTYSVRDGYNFEYVKGNFYTQFTQGNTGTLREFVRNESTGTLLTSFADLYISTNQSFDFTGSIGWFGRTTIEGRIMCENNTSSATVFYPFVLHKA